MDRTTTYMVLALVVLLGIGALIYANNVGDTPGTSSTGSGAGSTGTERSAPVPAPTPSTPPATKP